MFMEDYFSRFESQPNVAEVHLDQIFKKDVYKDYLELKPSTGILCFILFECINDATNKHCMFKKVLTAQKSFPMVDS